MEWKNPPPPTRLPWAERLAPLREHPHRWASFGDHDYATRRDINQGRRIKGITAGDYEAVNRATHLTGTGKYRGELFVRYVGADPCECGCLNQGSET